jgi:hypothetical protein
MKTREVKLPVLMIALLALTFVGLDGVLLVIVKVLDRATPQHESKLCASSSKAFRIAHLLIRDLGGPRVEKAPALTPSAKEKHYDPACTG